MGFLHRREWEKVEMPQGISKILAMFCIFFAFWNSYTFIINMWVFRASLCKSSRHLLWNRITAAVTVHNHSNTPWYFCVYIQTAGFFGSETRKSLKTSICRSQWEILQRAGEACWKMATLAVMNLLPVTALLEEQWKKKEAWEKSLPKMSIRQPVPRWSGISWMEAKQGAGEWTLQPMKLIKTLFIHLKVNFQYDWAANTLIPNLKVCETKTWSKYKQRANPLIKSSSAAAPGEDDLFY